MLCVCSLASCYHATDAGQVKNPKGLAIDSEGIVVVVDSGNHRILVFTQTGQLVRTFGSFGPGPVEFKSPWGLYPSTTQMTIFL